MSRTTSALIAVILTIAGLTPALHADAKNQYPSVVALNPLGYWPADEGEGLRLRNLGTTGKDALLFNTEWVNGALDFNAAFQFIEIPRTQATLSPTISLGTWVFVRKPRSGRHHDGRATYLLGNWARHWQGMPGPISICLTGKEKRTVEVVSNRKPDVVGSKAAGIELAAETWQHVLYTYSEGTGTLYINGKAVSSKTDIAYTPQAGEFIAGADAGWWALYPPQAEALDGSLREVVIFDRAISAEEAAVLAATPPTSAPATLAADELRLHGRFIKLGELNKLSVEDQRLAIRHMHLKRYGWVGDLPTNAATLQPYLAQALKVPLLRYDAALLLKKMKDSQTLIDAKPHLTQCLTDTTRDPADQATAARVLGLLGGKARDTQASLMALLRADVEANGVHILRMEAGLRNALITALLDIDATTPEVRELLGEVYAKPILDTMDLEQAYMAQIKELVAKEKYLNALDACRPIIHEQKLYFRSQGDPAVDQRDHWAANARAYTPVDSFNGYTYSFGNAKAFDGCAPVSQADYDRALAAYAKEYPDAATWMDGNVEGLFRADLTRTAPDGSTETIYMGGENFIFSGRDAKTKGWSVAIDKHGYIHAMGGQHNFPRASEFMPGAWESIGLSRERRADNHPTVLYWISKRPEDMSEFEFVGKKGHPQDIPAPFMNYMNFVQDRNGELYLYGRNDSGIQNWAFYHYDADARKWRDMGAERIDIFTEARKADPEWVKTVERISVYCHRGSIPDGRGASEHGSEYPSLCWAWQPFFYNYIRSNRGVQFDPDNRMIIEISILGYDARRRVSEATLVVYSDDRGKTFHRVDGTPVSLPLTNNPAPGHNADVLSGYSELYFKQWLQLINRIGYIF